MSRITKLPMPSNKENRTGVGLRAPTASVSKSLSEADKRSLLSNHTKPWNRTTSNVTTTGTSTLNKRPLTAAAPSLRSLPAKVTKEDNKPKPVPKITSKFDFKGRYEALLEKHKALRAELSELKQSNEELSDEHETLRSNSTSVETALEEARAQLQQTTTELVREKAEGVRTATELVTERATTEQLRRQTQVLAELAEGLKSKTAELEQLRAEHAELRRAHDCLHTEAEALRTLSQHLKTISVAHDALKLEHQETLQRATTARADADALQTMLAVMHKEQRDLRNTVQDLKGNIRVYCRVRPALTTEMERPLFNINFVDACSMELEKVELNTASASSRKGRQAQSFTFDGIFTPHVSQCDIFSEVAPLIQSALDGYNVCIFAYGQTGSGKTYTMEGASGEELHGIIPRAFNMMFTQVDELRRMGWTLNIVASFLEIYNENIYDLLDPSKDQEQHDIKMCDARGTDVYVTNLKEVEVRSCHEFVRHMMAAQRNRATAATVNNERSSRSHAVTRVRIAAVNAGRKERLTSHLNLVDLAGSESGKTTQRMAETCNINKSLSELKNVIVALRGNAAHVPYRNSKLTYLLMPSLGGNSKALMLVNVCQFDECFAETINSLRFALQVNSCRTVKAKKNITVVDL